MSASDDVRQRRHIPPGADLGRSGRGYRGFTQRHPLTAFALIAFPMGWAILSIPALAFHGVIPGGELPVEIFALGLTLLVMLPTTVWVVSVTDGRRGVRALFARTFRWRFSLVWWLVVLVGVPITGVAVGAALGRTVDTTDLSSVLLDGLTVGFLVPLVLVNLWEETVWAGFVQTRLEARHGLLVGAALTSVGFAGIHLPMLFAAELSASVLLESLGFLVVAAIIFRLTAGLVMRGAAGSVLAVAVLHAGWNASSGEDGLVDDLLSGGQPVLIAVLALTLVTAALVALVRPRLYGEAQGEPAAGIPQRS
jgi:membrane protease YdiL (CAAX protease family)